MIPPEAFTTARLQLRRTRPGDADALFEMLGDSEVTRHISQPRLTDPVQAVRMLEEVEQLWRTGGNYNWAIATRPGDAMIGMLGIHQSTYGIELGFALRRSQWGHGFGEEAARAVLDWALDQPDVHRVWALVGQDNTASHRIVQTLGMVAEGVLHRVLPNPETSDTPVDAVMYAKWR